MSAAGEMPLYQNGGDLQCPAIIAGTTQERLGHSTITTTLDLYSHAAPTLQEQAVTALDERFGKRGA